MKSSKLHRHRRNVKAQRPGGESDAGKTPSPGQTRHAPRGEQWRTTEEMAAIEARIARYQELAAKGQPLS